MQPQESLIETCAKIAESVRAEIEATRAATLTKTARYDRPAAVKRLSYGVQVCERIAARIRGLNGGEARAMPKAADTSKGAQAIRLLNELRPVISSSRDSAWRAQMLEQIDYLVDSNR